MAQNGEGIQPTPTPEGQNEEGLEQTGEDSQVNLTKYYRSSEANQSTAETESAEEDGSAEKTNTDTDPATDDSSDEPQSSQKSSTVYESHPRNSGNNPWSYQRPATEKATQASATETSSNTAPQPTPAERRTQHKRVTGAAGAPNGSAESTPAAPTSKDQAPTNADYEALKVQVSELRTAVEGLVKSGSAETNNYLKTLTEQNAAILDWMKNSEAGRAGTTPNQDPAKGSTSGFYPDAYTKFTTPPKPKTPDTKDTKSEQSDPGPEVWLNPNSDLGRFVEEQKRKRDISGNMETLDAVFNEARASENNSSHDDGLRDVIAAYKAQVDPTLSDEQALQAAKAKGILPSSSELQQPAAPTRRPAGTRNGEGHPTTPDDPAPTRAVHEDDTDADREEEDDDTNEAETRQKEGRMKRIRRRIGEFLINGRWSRKNSSERDYEDDEDGLVPGLRDDDAREAGEDGNDDDRSDPEATRRMEPVDPNENPRRNGHGGGHNNDHGDDDRPHRRRGGGHHPVIAGVAGTGLLLGAAGAAVGSYAALNNSSANSAPAPGSEQGGSQGGSGSESGQNGNNDLGKREFHANNPKNGIEFNVYDTNNNGKAGKGDTEVATLNGASDTSSIWNGIEAFKNYQNNLGGNENAPVKDSVVLDLTNRVQAKSGINDQEARHLPVGTTESATIGANGQPTNITVRQP